MLELAKRVASTALLLVAAACRSPATPPPATRPALSLSGYAREVAWATGDPAVDALQDLLRPTLEANRKEFAGRRGTVRGFGAGEVYPQVWLRDSATLIPATRYYYGVEHLTSWLEEHLAQQRPDGQLWDWIAAGEPGAFRANAPRAREVHRAGPTVLSADKNTTASDQETSAVDAAGQVFALTGRREWLAAPVEGRRLLDRLAAAAAYVWREKRHDGLVTAALTADWGDVSPAYPDQRVIYLDERTPRVESLYASVLLVRAADVLAELFTAAGEPDRARDWSERAASMRARVRERLWQEERGFFRLARALAEPRPPDVDLADRFALGGNGLAALYGVADDREAPRLFAAAEQRNRDAGISTVAGVLLPPFPSGFFLHPILKDEYTYQNGGQWDWWAGRFLLAEFERGGADAAFRQLRDIAARIAAAGGLYEWNTRKGRGKGSAHYAGSAGALSAAVFRGLFGIDSRAASLALTVRLGPSAGAVRVYEPAIDRYVAYRYEPDVRARRVRLAFESNAPGRGALRVRLPPGAGALEGAWLDDRPLTAVEETVGSDRYAKVESDWRPHVLQVRWRP
jgi:Mannosylglycerate hydrolase MGH1-like glycoside hydrolase domain